MLGVTEPLPVNPGTGTSGPAELGTGLGRSGCFTTAQDPTHGSQIVPLGEVRTNVEPSSSSIRLAFGDTGHL